MTEPLPLPAVTLRCTWAGLGAPRVGYFMMSDLRPRYAYQVTGVARAKRHPRAGTDCRTYRLTCARWRAGDVPAGSTVLRWHWDKR